MAYATQADLEDAVGGSARLVQFTDWDNDRQPDVARIAAYLDKATNEINSYLVKQRLVPLAAPFPPVVVDVCARLALYRIARSRGMLTDDIRQDYEDDVKWLTAVSEGKIGLDVDPQPTKTSMRIDTASPRPTAKDVSRAKLKGFS